MKVQIDQDTCVGSGMCVLNLPEVFDQRDEDGIGVVLEADPPDELQAEVRRAAALCPSGALRLVEE